MELNLKVWSFCANVFFFYKSARFILRLEKLNFQIQENYIFNDLYILKQTFVWPKFATAIPAGARRPGDVPWRSPKGLNVRDLQGNFRGLLGDQQKNWKFN